MTASFRLVLALALTLAAVGTLGAAEPGDRRRTLPVSIAGAPRTLVTVSIEVPSELSDADSLRFSVELQSGVEVLGRRAGAVSRHPETGAWRPVMLTIRVPANARVGLVEVADVVFDDGDGREIAVPIVLRVPTVNALKVEAPKAYRALIGGDRVDLTYRIQNEGNAPERLLVETRTPRGWRFQSIDTTRVVVEAFGTVDAQVSLRVPVGTNRGEYYAAVNVIRADTDSLALPTAVTALLVEARDEPQAGGLTLRPLTAVTATSQGGGLTAALRADGEVADGVYLRAQLLPQAPRNGLESIALASVGALGNPFQASLSAATWSLDAGLVSADLSPLTGVLAIAEGVSGRAQLGAVDARAFAGRSGLRGSATGSHVGGGAWMTTAYGDLGATASMRRESFGAGFDRELTALGVEWGRSFAGDLRINTGLALRGYNGGAGMGLRLEGLRDYRAGRVRTAFTHAAGGSAAFAPAVDNFEADVAHRFSERWRASANVRTARDEAASGLRTSSFVLGVGQDYDWSAATILSFNGTATRFAGEAREQGIGRFGSSTFLGSVGGSHRRGAWVFGSTVQLGIVGRDAELASGATSEVRVLQRGAQVTASRALANIGQLSLGTSRTLTGAGAGQPTDVTTVFGRFGSTPLMVAGLPLRGTADFQVIRAALNPTLLAWRIGGSTPLPGGLELETSLERNPFFVDARGRAGWALAMRVSAATSVFRPQRAGASGVVFEDRNGNGEQDPGEPGVSGVQVSLRDLRLSSDRAGRFTLPRGVRGRVRVDVTSLPLGWVVHPRVSAAVEEDLDIPLVPTGTLDLTLVIDPDEDGRRPTVDLTDAQVWLVDRDGREWLGRTLPDGTLRFENIPAGRYGVRSDLSRLSEPLRVVDGESVDVQPGAERGHTVHLRGRVVRIIQPPSRGTGGRGGRGAGRGRTQ